MKLPISRRDFNLRAVAAAIAAAGQTGFADTLFAQGAVTPEQFLALSQRLTETADLDPDVAKTLLGGFLATGHGAALALLVAGKDTDPASQSLANAIVAAWYSGLYDTGKGQAVATYDEALAWNALSFTKPLGECGGDTGYWSMPPQG